MFVRARPSTRALLERLAREKGLAFEGVTREPAGRMLQLKPVRIGLWDRYGGSMPSGWMRWLFEQFEFPFEVVHPQTLDAGNLRERFDVLVFVDGAIPPPGGTGRPRFAGAALPPERVPQEFRSWLGEVTAAKTVPQLKAFLEAGGTIATIGSSTALAGYLDLAVSNALVERTASGDRPLPREKFFIPGSLLRAAVNPRHPLAFGMPDRVDVMFDESPVFALPPSAAFEGVTPVVWFDSPAPLRSGWAWGQQYLKGGVAVAEARVGRGRLFLYGPEITFRAQPHGTFKLLFNGLLYGPAAEGGP